MTQNHGVIPPLENGDRADPRTSFERRYDAMPELKKAESGRRRGLHALTGPTRAARATRIPGWLPGWEYETDTLGVEAGR